MKTAYVCGPLTELLADSQHPVKRFYEAIADVFWEVTGVRAFVPHEHYDPILHAGFSPQEVDTAERHQVCNMTNLLVVVASFIPSWGGGIEVEMANTSGVPVIIIHHTGQRVSRLLRGNPAVIEVVPYVSEQEALQVLRARFKKLFSAAAA